MNEKQLAQGRGAAGHMGFAGTAFLLLAGVVVLAALCTAAYRAVITQRDASDALRGTLSYISAQVESHDVSACVSVRDDMLVLSEHDGEQTYELRIYARDGQLLEEYSAAQTPQDPDSAAPIAQTATFAVTFVRPDLLRVSTDAGTGYVHLFAGGEGVS